nr:hypothetical protein [Candidatus Njordarchaeota archaeon]
MPRKLAIPAAIVRFNSSDEEQQLLGLLRHFNNARRRAYTLKQQGTPKAEIERVLQGELRLNSRYVKDAYHSIKSLPPHVAFGGLRLQRLRESGKITREEYRERRNSLIISRGDKTKHGNLNTRITTRGDGKLALRVNVGRHWIYPEVYLPPKYLERYGHLFFDEESTSPYTVVIKRRENCGGYQVRVIVEAPLREANRQEELKRRVMALDVNAGHVDFAVAEKQRVLAAGKVNCHEVQYASRNRTGNLLHAAVNKIGNIADHYGARVVYGRLSTAGFKAGRRANRKVRRIPHRKLGFILEYKCGAEKRSEAYTTKIGARVSRLVGLDVHKCAAAAFALKILDYEAFKGLCSSRMMGEISRGAALDEGDGSLRRQLSVGSGLTALHQDRLLVHDEVALCGDGGHPIAPGVRGLSFMESLKTSLPILNVRIC